MMRSVSSFVLDLEPDRSHRWAQATLVPVEQLVEAARAVQQVHRGLTAGSEMARSREL